MLSRLGWEVSSLLKGLPQTQNPVSSILIIDSVTASIGQSSIIHADRVIDAACEPNSKYTIPQNLRHHLLISKYITRINSVMAEIKRSETRYPLDRDICVLMNVLERDFVDLETHIGQSLSGVTLFSILALLRLIRM
jgi:hypothetical protein